LIEMGAWAWILPGWVKQVKVWKEAALRNHSLPIKERAVKQSRSKKISW
jgi:hypothetical protein